MPAYKVEICGVNTSTLPVLNENQKKELFTRIRQGDQQAREEYIRGNLRLGFKCDPPFFRLQRKCG